MDKIKELLKQLNASDELAGQIVESIDSFVTSQKTILENEYKERLKLAKEACLNEVNEYKNELARKAQIFFETRADRVEAQIAKQVAIRESAAEGTLKQVKTMLEGIQVDTQGKVDLQAVESKLANLQKENKVFREERDQAVSKANRAANIADKSLKRTRQLEILLAESKKEQPAVEAPAPAAPALTEGKDNGATLPVDQPFPARKTAAQPVTTNVVAEGTVARPKKSDQPDSAPTPATKTMKWGDPGSIASMIED